MKPSNFLIIVILYSLLLEACRGSSIEPFPTGNFIGIASPADTPTIFGEGYISTQHNNRDITFSPDMDEIYFTTTNKKSTFSVIMTMKKRKGIWSEPEIASFSGRYPDIEPMFAPDGNALFFASRRPLKANQSTKDWDIWKVERTDEGWSEPINLGDAVNTPKDEFYPSIAANGNLYFTAQYDTNSLGAEDIYRAKWEDGDYQKAENIGDSVNTRFYEFNAYVAPDESYLIYTSYGRPDGVGGGDLYITFKDSEGEWGKTKLFPFNSKALDYCPSVTPDGQVFFYTSDKPTHADQFDAPINVADFEEMLTTDGGNIYWIRADKWIN